MTARRVSSVLESLGAPHRSIPTQSARELLAVRLFDRLWTEYRRRVPYVQAYERVVARAGATFVNDHIAFRTLAVQSPATGIATIARIFEALGYQAAGCYAFPEKRLSAVHYQHANPQFPKLFVSELRTWELSEAARKAVLRTTSTHRRVATDALLAGIARLERRGEVDSHLRKLAPIFLRLPWEPPEKRDVLRVHAESQFGAWVMLHGYAVNHFTALINSHGADALSDVEKTAAALRAEGAPMKTEIEGAPGSKLRQTATEAAVAAVRVRDGGRIVKIPWTYAYFELAERGVVEDPETGRPQRFEGFLGPQATQLFEMTQVRAR
jgi:hypothetical protein